jgi:hypothetical protein
MPDDTDDLSRHHVSPHALFADGPAPAAFHRCLLRAAIDLDLPWRLTVEKLGLGLLECRKTEGSA